MMAPRRERKKWLMGRRGTDGVAGLEGRGDEDEAEHQGGAEEVGPEEDGAFGGAVDEDAGGGAEEEGGEGEGDDDPGDVRGGVGEAFDFDD